MKKTSATSLIHASCALLASLALAACAPSTPEAAQPAASAAPAAVETAAVAPAVPAHALVTLPVGAAMPVDYTKQVAAWKASGQVSDALVLQQFDGPEPPNFSALTVLDFPSEAAYDSWKAAANLGPDMIVSRVDVLTHSETKQKNSPEGIYVVGQYESLVSQAGYQDYTDAYIVPNMANQMFSGIMTRYTMYMERSPTAGMTNPKTFLVTEYLNQAEFDRKKSVKDAYKVALHATHPEWTRINGIKSELRNDMNETLAHAVPLN